MCQSMAAPLRALSSQSLCTHASPGRRARHRQPPRLQQRRKEREAAEAMAAEMAAKVAAEEAEAEAVADRERQRRTAQQRAEIVTPGQPGSRRTSTPRRQIGL